MRVAGKARQKCTWGPVRTTWLDKRQQGGTDFTGGLHRQNLVMLLSTGIFAVAFNGVRTLLQMGSQPPQTPALFPAADNKTWGFLNPI